MSASYCLSWVWTTRCSVNIYNSGFVVAKLQHICVSEGKPMRLAMPYLGTGLCAPMAVWMSMILLY